MQSRVNCANHQCDDVFLQPSNFLKPFLHHHSSPWNFFFRKWPYFSRTDQFKSKCKILSLFLSSQLHHHRYNYILFNAYQHIQKILYYICIHKRTAISVLTASFLFLFSVSLLLLFCLFVCFSFSPVSQRFWPVRG